MRFPRDIYSAISFNECGFLALAARLVSGKSIAEWVFKPSQVTQWTGEGVWEILHNAVVKSGRS